MIKSWLKFNENTNELRSQLSEKLTEVRDVLTDFEDMGIISYSMVSSDFERGGRAHHRRGYISFDPKVGDINRFLDFQLPTLTVTSKKLEKVCIIVDIKLPGESNEFGSTVIGNEGIKLFDDMLTANSRLIEAGYDVKMDLNGSHGQYKPVKFLIYFNI